MNEREFSKELRTALRKAGFAVRAIETGGTGAGVPDLFVAGNGVATFIEVKSRMNRNMYGAARDPALLRPGQKQFAVEFARGTVSAYAPIGLRCMVAVCCKDGMFIQSIDGDGDWIVVAWCSWEERGLKAPAWLRKAIVSGYYGGTSHCRVNECDDEGKEDA